MKLTIVTQIAHFFRLKVPKSMTIKRFTLTSKSKDTSSRLEGASSYLVEKFLKPKLKTSGKVHLRLFSENMFLEI